MALSLKTVGGFSVREIARAFLADESTIAQRIVRTKKLIRERKLTLDLPSGPELAQRLDAVLDVIYFMFNEGYAAHEGVDLIRQDLCMEALRLGRLVADADAFDVPRVHALVALMALQAARLPARVDEAGDLDAARGPGSLAMGRAAHLSWASHFDRSMAGAEVTEYHVQAAIAATTREPRCKSIEWRTILELYDQLLEMTASPIVALNRAVAVAKVHGSAAGLDALETISRDPKLQHYHLLLAARGQLLAELGRSEDAANAFAAALERGCTEPSGVFCSGASRCAGTRLGFAPPRRIRFGFVFVPRAARTSTNTNDEYEDDA